MRTYSPVMPSGNSSRPTVPVFNQFELNFAIPYPRGLIFVLRLRKITVRLFSIDFFAIIISGAAWLLKGIIVEE